MHLGLGMVPQLRQELKLRLTPEQQIRIEGRLFELRLALVGALRDERYEPRARCPNCDIRLEPGQILAGFNDDPTDFTTECPRKECKHRFQPSLVCFGTGSQIELPFFCSAQTLHQLNGLERLTPEEFSQQHPAIFRAAIAHHGSLAGAFKKIDITYAHVEDHDWKSKIGPFLGRLPDKTIAELVHTTPRTIAAMRKRLKIKPASRRKILDEVE